MDYQVCGMPDVSYHGVKAWVPEFDHFRSQLGILYCGEYGRKPDGTADDSFFVAYNMHWEPHDFALPKLMKGKRWNLTIDTAEATKPESRSEDDSGQSVTLPGRCVRIYISEETPKVRKTAGCK